MNRKDVILAVLAVSIVVNAVLIYHFFQSKTKTSSQATAQNPSQYPLLSRRVFAQNPSDTIINFLSLRNELEGMVAPWGEDFSFYFEYLPTGTSVGVNSNVQFFAASLFKLPVIMAYYHYLERTGADRNQIFTIEKEDLDNQFGNLWKKGAGTKITGTDAVKLALTESDNTAAKLIARQVNQKDFDDVYRALDLDLLTGKGGALMTTREYGVILKALFFSAILNKDDSSEILKYLTMSKFDEKLVAGVSEDVPIAHKIGDFNDSKGSKAFYDCGIVYLPKRPYMLCMSSVGDEGEANARMMSVSRAVYDYVKSAN